MRWARAMAFLALAWIGIAAQAQTLLSFSPEVGGHVVSAQARTLTPADGDFTVTTVGGQIRVEFRAPNFAEFWWLELRGANGQPLAPGFFKGALQSIYGVPTKPGFDFNGSGRNCTQVDGAFRIHELEQRSDGTVIRFAVDFVQRCNGGAPRLFGALRYNSARPVDLQTPIANAGRSRTVLEGERVVVDALESISFAPGGLTYRWTQLDGLPVTLAGSLESIAVFHARRPQSPGAKLRLRLRVTDSIGRFSEDDVEFAAQGRDTVRSYLQIDSDVGDPVGRGLQRGWTGDDGAFGFFSFGTAAVDRAGVSFDAGPDRWWLTLGAPQGQALAPGSYPNATSYAFQPASGNWLEVYSFNGGSCGGSLTGSFRILALERAAGGAMQRLAADFVQQCNGSTGALRGRLFVNQAPVGPPSAVISAPTSVPAGSPVLLDAAGSTDPGGRIMAYRWQQVAGPAVTLADVDLPQSTFVMPALPAGSAPVVMQLLVTDDEQNVAVAEASVGESTIGPPVPPPAGVIGGGGGGGAQPAHALALLLAGLAARRRGRQRLA